MILTLAVAVGLVVGLARHRGHAFRQIAALPLRSVWLALLSVALQLPLLRAPTEPIQHVSVQQALFLLSYLLLLIFVWRNWRLTSVQILGLGVVCNLLAIAVNGGFMPITPQTLTRINPGSTPDQWLAGLHYGYSKDIVLLREQTRLQGLSDTWVIPPPFPWPTAFSIGDMLIAIGIMVLLQGSSVDKQPSGQAAHDA
jgi:hypothetical protein